MQNQGTLGVDLANNDFIGICRFAECPNSGTTRQGQVSQTHTNIRNFSAKLISNATWQRDVWIAHYKIGVVEERSGDFDAARAAYQRAVDGAAKMLAAHPDDPTMKSDHDEIVAWLAGCCSRTRD